MYLLYVNIRKFHIVIPLTYLFYPIVLCVKKYYSSLFGHSQNATNDFEIFLVSFIYFTNIPKINHLLQNETNKLKKYEDNLTDMNVDEIKEYLALINNPKYNILILFTIIDVLCPLQKTT